MEHVRERRVPAEQILRAKEQKGNPTQSDREGAESQADQKVSAPGRDERGGKGDHETHHRCQYLH
jgi:hypothetical protein